MPTASAGAAPESKLLRPTVVAGTLHPSELSSDVDYEVRGFWAKQPYRFVVRLAPEVVAKLRADNASLDFRRGEFIRADRTRSPVFDAAIGYRRASRDVDAPGWLLRASQNRVGIPTTELNLIIKDGINCEPCKVFLRGALPSVDASTWEPLPTRAVAPAMPAVSRPMVWSTFDLTTGIAYRASGSWEGRPFTLPIWFDEAAIDLLREEASSINLATGEVHNRDGSITPLSSCAADYQQVTGKKAPPFLIRGDKTRRIAIPQDGISVTVADGRLKIEPHAYAYAPRQLKGFAAPYQFADLGLDGVPVMPAEAEQRPAPTTWSGQQLFYGLTYAANDLWEGKTIHLEVFFDCESINFLEANPARKVDLARAVYIDENGLEHDLSSKRQLYRETNDGEPPRWLCQDGHSALLGVPKGRVAIVLKGNTLALEPASELLFRHSVLAKNPPLGSPHADKTPITRDDLTAMGYRDRSLGPSLSIFGPPHLDQHVPVKMHRVLGGALATLAKRNEQPHPLTVVMLPPGKHWSSMPQAAEQAIEEDETTQNAYGLYAPKRDRDFIFIPVEDVEGLNHGLDHELDHYARVRLLDAATRAALEESHRRAIKEGRPLARIYQAKNPSEHSAVLQEAYSGRFGQEGFGFIRDNYPWEAEVKQAMGSGKVLEYIDPHKKKKERRRRLKHAFRLD
ncbi:MAG: hypothetical protein ACKVPX_10300 [Myxococcaceae bacterium]